jgi:hypothetical protein
MVAVTKTNIFSTTYKVIRDVLIDEVTDPKKRFKTSIIHSKRQFPSASNFCGYPYIVIYNVTNNELSKSNDQSKISSGQEITVEVIANSPEDCDSLSDEVYSILSDSTTTSSITLNSLANLKIETNFSRDVIDGEDVYIRELIIRGYTRL